MAVFVDTGIFVAVRSKGDLARLKEVTLAIKGTAW